MTSSTDPMNAPSAIGIILICLAVLWVILWGFGLDRFLWIAAGTGLAGVGLVGVGVILSLRTR